MLQRITNHSDDMSTRIQLPSLSLYFHPLCQLSEIESDYNFAANRESEISLNADQTHVQRVVEAVVTGSETLDDIIADWNARWNAAVDRYAPAA